jgi:tetratricopeptide (TPR) repeat protein
MLAAIAGTTLAVAVAALLLIKDGEQAAPSPSAFVGSEVCATCHQAETALWRASQHSHAMAHATDATVLGDFNDATFESHGVRSRFFRRDGKFLAETDGPDGALATFEITYTFGLDPLQQYLIAFPDGRVQALSIAWDNRPKAQGGQRWFHLYPDEPIRHTDPLHWTRLNQNWNFMCAECHSTGVRKNYDAAKDRFATTFAEISVGCEACHGRGARHVTWAKDRQRWWRFGTPDTPDKGLAVRFDERRDIAWSSDEKTGQPRRSAPPALLRKEVETCGLCHARRGAMSDEWTPGRWLSDTHVVMPIAQGLYHADGQMRDEVYNYGSFKQSRMFEAGVTCSDCHDPHSARLRLPGDDTCLQCHSAESYAGPAHHRHAGANPPLLCASCHMPVRTYMGIDRRHDHGFRGPRPDVSVKLGTPNACTDCHADKPAAWAATAIERWHGPARKGLQSYAEAFDAAFTGNNTAAARLLAVANDRALPAFARASALSALAPHASPANVEAARASLADPDPMVRIGALDLLEAAPAPEAWRLAAPLLSDPVRGVRIRAASLLAAMPPGAQPPADRAAFERAAAEFIAAQQLNADRPEARTALADLYIRQGRFADAESNYRAALRLSRHSVPAAVNLADLYRHLRREGEGETVLRTAVATSPNDATLHHALGLTLVRLGRRDDALAELRAAAALAPDDARYAYVYAAGLQASGRIADALAVVKQGLTRHPDDRDLSALAAELGHQQVKPERR